MTMDGTEIMQRFLIITKKSQEHDEPNEAELAYSLESSYVNMRVFQRRCIQTPVNTSVPFLHAGRDIQKKEVQTNKKISLYFKLATSKCCACQANHATKRITVSFFARHESDSHYKNHSVPTTRRPKAVNGLEKYTGDAFAVRHQLILGVTISRAETTKLNSTKSLADAWASPGPCRP